MGRRRHGPRTRRWIAIVAAYLFVLQSLLTGLAVEAHAVTGPDGDVAFMLCAPGAMDMQQDEGAPATDGRFNCCVAGCSLGGGAVPPAADAFTPVAYRIEDRIAFANHRDEPRGFLAWHSPACPRGPPAAA